jgi:hypothetical protein
VVGAVLLVVVGQCRDDSDVVAGAQARDSAQRSDSARRSAPSDSAAARNRREAEASSEASQPSRSAAPSGEHDGDKQTAAAALDVLQVKGRAPMTGYDRDRFGQAWLDADRNGCDTRNDVLGEYLREVTLEGNGCVVSAGSYDDPYTGSKIDYWQGHGALLDIDHVVSLGNAWATGAFGWPIRQRAAFANDPLNLLPADAGANRQKGDGDAATWLPPNASYRCQYVSRQVAVKAKYDLWVTAPEKAAIQRVWPRATDRPSRGTAGAPQQRWTTTSPIRWTARTTKLRPIHPQCRRLIRPPVAAQCTTTVVTQRAQPVQPRFASEIRATARTSTGTGTEPAVNDDWQITGGRVLRGGVRRVEPLAT